MSNQSVRDNILGRILEFEPGEPIAFRKLRGYGSDSATQRWVKHFCQKGTLTRVMTGFYVRPKPIASLPNITITCEPEALAKAWAQEKGYILTTSDIEELYRLRFQTQMPSIPSCGQMAPAKSLRSGMPLCLPDTFLHLNSYGTTSRLDAFLVRYRPSTQKRQNRRSWCVHSSFLVTLKVRPVSVSPHCSKSRPWPSGRQCFMRPKI